MCFAFFFAINHYYSCVSNLAVLATQEKVLDGLGESAVSRGLLLQQKKGGVQLFLLSQLEGAGVEEKAEGNGDMVFSDVASPLHRN